MNPLFPHGEKKMQAKSVWIKHSTLVLPLLCLIIFGTVIGVRLIGSSTGAGAATLVPLKGNVPALVKTSTVTGPANANQTLTLTIGLKLRNAEALQTYANNAIRSRSTRKPQHLTPAQIDANFAPLASSQQAVASYLQSYGFTVTTDPTQRLIIDLRGTVQDAENAFHIQINNYRSAKGRNFYAPSSDPLMPVNLAGLVTNISGLDNVAYFTHPPLAKQSKSKASLSSNSVSCLPAGTGTPPVLLPSQVATAYNLTGFYNAGFYGEGQTVALVEFDDYSSSDISAYTHCYGENNNLPTSVPINRVKVDGGNGGDGAAPGDGSIEVEMDMELILGADPHLAGLDVYEAPNDTQGSNDMWAQIIKSDTIPVISTSWGDCESEVGAAEMQEENSLFTIAAAQGQTIFASSGDAGTEAYCAGSNTYVSGVSDPSSQPYVTGVGGTTLTLGSGNSYGSETVWNDGAGDASGGGISAQWTMPSWQQGPGVIETATPPGASSGTPCGAPSGSYCREVPDVSLNADPNSGEVVYCTVGYCSGAPSPWWYAGGTSASAPMWAAFMALTNEKTLHDGGFNIGFINPYLYQIDQNASGTSYSNDFHDITSGNNDTVDGDGYPYAAIANYDMASGLGSYNGLNLAADLEKLANAQNGTRQAPAATTWYFAEGRVGGGFQEYLTILNPSTQTANVTVQYLFQGQQAQSKNYTVGASSRFTINVNSELGYPAGGAAQSISAIVTSNVGVVVERPMYFTYNGIHSGTDVLGATAPGTSFYFAQGDSSQTSTDHTNEFITILNPSQTATANLTVTYYSGGKAVETDTVSVGPLQRGTTSPTFHGQAAVAVTSDIGVVVERPSYFSGNVPSAGGAVSGAASTIGATTPGTDWLFAEGNTAADFQEDLVLANFGSASANVTVNLEYTGGTEQSVAVTVAPESQFYFNVNNYKGPSNSVSAEVTSDQPIVAERVMYFHYSLNGSVHPGYNDVVGQAGPASQSVYDFAEGAAGTNFGLWLTLQNPNSSAVTVAITIFADNTIIQKEMTLVAHSRSSVLVNNIVNPIVAAYPNSAGYSVSMEVQSSGGPIVVERPEYFTFDGDTGGTDVIGYTGG